jgi:hypothetical protein
MKHAIFMGVAVAFAAAAIACGTGYRLAGGGAHRKLCWDRPLGKTTIGVIAVGMNAYFEEASGGVMGTMKDVAGVSVEGSPGYHMFYVPDPEGGATVDVLTGYSSSGIPATSHYEHVTLATAKSLKMIGIEDPFTLVVLEANCGDEGSLGPSFVVTRLIRLGGTEDYPLNLSAVVKDLLAKNEDFLNEMKPEIDEEIAARKEEVFKHKGAGMKSDRTVIPLVSWEGDHLVVTIRSIIVETEMGWGCPIQTQDPCAAASARITVECSVTYSVDRKGNVIDTEKAPLTGSAEGLQPPP